MNKLPLDWESNIKQTQDFSKELNPEQARFVNDFLEKGWDINNPSMLKRMKEVKVHEQDILNLDHIRNMNPPMYNFLVQPKNYAMSRNEIEQLSLFDRFFTKVSKTFKDNIKQLEISKYKTKMVDEPEPEKRGVYKAIIDGYQNSISEIEGDNVLEKLILGGIKGSSQVYDSTINEFDNIALGTGVGTGVGAGVGSLFGGIGTIPGAIVGAKIGAQAGYMRNMFNLLYGDIYQSLEKEDASPLQKRIVANGLAMATSWLELVQLRLLGGLFKSLPTTGTIGQLVSNTMKKYVTNNTMKRLMLGAATYVTNVLGVGTKEFASEMTQEAIENFGPIVVTAMNKEGKYLPEYQRENLKILGEQLLNSTEDVFYTTYGMAMLGSVVGSGKSTVIRAVNNINHKINRDKVYDTIDASEILKSPNGLKEVFANYNITSANIDAENLDSLNDEVKENIIKKAGIKSTYYKKALKAGIELKLTPEQFLKIFKDNTIKDYVKRITTFNKDYPTDMTLEKENQFLQEEAKVQLDYVKEFEKNREEIANNVDFETLNKKEYNMYEDVKSYFTDVMTSRFMALEKMIPGFTMQDFNESLPLKSNFYKGGKKGAGGKFFYRKDKDGKYKISVNQKGFGGDNRAFATIVVHELMHSFDTQLSELAKKFPEAKKQLSKLNRTKKTLLKRYKDANLKELETLKKENPDFYNYLLKPEEIIARAAEYGFFRDITDNAFTRQIFRDQQVLLQDSLGFRNKLDDKSLYYQGLDTKNFIKDFFFTDEVFDRLTTGLLPDDVGKKAYTKLAKMTNSDKKYSKMLKENKKFAVDMVLSKFKKMSNKMYKSLAGLVSPDHLDAVSYILDNKIKLNAEAYPNLPDKFTSKDGILINDIASDFDLTTEELLDSIGKLDVKNAREFSKFISKLLSTDGFSNKVLDTTITELGMIQETLGYDKEINYQSYKQDSEEMFNNLDTNQARDYNYFTKKFKQYGQLSSAAILRNDYTGALAYKQKQIYMWHFQNMSKNFDKRYKNVIQSQNKFISNKKYWSERLKYDFYMAALSVLDIFGQGKNIYTQEKARFSLREFHEKNFKEAILPNDLDKLESYRGRDIKQLSVNDFNHMHNIFLGLKSAGINFNIVESREESIILDEKIPAFVKSINMAKDREWRGGDDETPGTAKYIQGTLNRLTNSIAIFENLKGRGAGEFTDFIRNTMFDSERKYNTLRLNAKNELTKLHNEFLGNDYHKSKGREIIKVGDKTFTRSEMLYFNMNIGNEYNLERLRNDDRFKNFLKNDKDVYKFTELLDKKEWSYIKGIWELIKKYADSSNQVLKDMGEYVPMEKLNKKYTIKTKDGYVINIEGGYFPIRKKIVNSITDVGSDEDFSNNNEDTLVPMGRSFFQKDLSFSNYQVDLSPSIVSRFLTDASRQIAFRKTQNYLSKILNKPEIRGALKSKFSYVDPNKVINSWVKNLITNAYAPSTTYTGKWLTRGRRVFVFTQIGFNIGTALIQTSGLITGLNQVKSIKYMLRGLNDVFLNRSDLTEFVNKYSAIMPTRGIDYNRDIRDIMLSTEKMSKGQAWEKLGFAMNRFMDYNVSLAVWQAEFQKQFDINIKKMSEEAAIKKSAYDADNTVLLTQGSGSEISLSSLFASKNQLVRLFTTFGTWGNTLFNLAMANTGWDKVKTLFMMAAVLPAYEYLIKNSLSGILDDAENEPENIYNGLLFQSVNNIANTIPFGGGVSYSLFTGKQLSLPAVQPLSDIIGTAKDVKDLAVDLYEGERLTMDDWLKVLTGVGNGAYFVTGNPFVAMPRQLQRSLNALATWDDFEYNGIDEKVTHFLIKNKYKKR